MLSCPQSIGGLALLLTRALSFFHGGIHPRLQVAHRPLCEIATTSPNGVVRQRSPISSNSSREGFSGRRLPVCPHVLRDQQRAAGADLASIRHNLPRRPSSAAQSTFDNFDGDP